MRLSAEEREHRLPVNLGLLAVGGAGTCCSHPESPPPPPSREQVSAQEACPEEWRGSDELGQVWVSGCRMGKQLEDDNDRVLPTWALDQEDTGQVFIP